MPWIEDDSYPSGWRWESPSSAPPTKLLPTVSELQVLPVVVPTGQDDHLLVRTENGLRPEDEALAQPPQDPAWSPDAHR